MIRWGFLAAAMLGTAGFAAAQDAGTPPPQRVVTYQGPGTLRLTSNLPLSDIAQAALEDEFRPTTYFGAFAYAKSGGYGYSTTTNSLAAARTIALAECLAQNDACLVVAEIVPEGYTPLAAGDFSLTPEVAEIYLNPTFAGAPKGQLRAMAVSEDGAYSLNWGFATQAEVDAAALSDCEGHRVTDLGELTPMPCVLMPNLP